MANIFTEIDGLLREGRAIALARIVSQSGSVPRETGVKCLVMEDGSVRGTIGGGRLEYETARRARDNFASRRSFLLHFELTGADAASAEKMICGGVADVYVEYLSPDNGETCLFFEKISDIIRDGKRGVLLTRIAEGIDSGSSACRAFLTEDGSVRGSIEGYSPDDLAKQQLLEAGKAAIQKISDDAPVLFIEPIVQEDAIYIFGAGHISTCLAPLAKMLGFRLTVADDRAEFCNAERFPHADELLVAPFAEVFDRLSFTSSSYIVIVTRGHLHDLTVLREALRHSPAYIGMIGSRRKIKMVFQLLSEEGVSKEILKTIHAPIGLAIGAESPEEIAVCIAAELIKVRAELRKGL